MNAPTVATQPLPLQVSPAQDETWHSYLVGVAALHACTVAELGLHLRIRDRNGRWPAYYGLKVTGDWSERAAGILGLDHDQIRAMHLEVYDQVAVDLRPLDGSSGINTTRLVAQRSWVHLAGSAYCPRCLTDGIWRLAWRLPWTTVCPDHRVFLETECPACLGIPGTGNTLRGSAPNRADAKPDGRLCERPGDDEPGHRFVCGEDLTAVRGVSTDSASQRRARTLAEVIRQRRGEVAGQSWPSLQTLDAWRDAACLASHFGRLPDLEWGRNHRWGTPPRNRQTMDRALAAAEVLVTVPDTDSAADILEQWGREAGHRSIHADTFARATKGSRALEPVISALLRRRGRAHVIAQRRLPIQSLESMETWDADDVPQLVWPCALPESRRLSRKPNPLILRAVVALIVVRIRTGAVDWGTSGAMLGFPAHRSRQWTRYCFASAHNGLKDELVAAAHALMSVMPEQPGSGNWSSRPQLTGCGLSTFARAQAPACHQGGPDAWCPCRTAHQHSEGRKTT